MNENRWIHVKERGATRILFYSICAVVPVFITDVRIKEKEIECAFHFAASGHCLRISDTKGSTCLLWDITTEKSGLCCYAVRITQKTYVKK